MITAANNPMIKPRNDPVKIQISHDLSACCWNTFVLRIEIHFIAPHCALKSIIPNNRAAPTRNHGLVHVLHLARTIKYARRINDKAVNIYFAAVTGITSLQYNCSIVFIY